MNNKIPFVLLFSISILAPAAVASNAISGGVWFNHRNVLVEDDFNDAEQRDQATLGDIQSEALILYLDYQKKESPWKVSAEWRAGPGSFTDPANNSSGDNFGFHKAWVAYHFNDSSTITVGKSQVPFGWKTTNFWPGDMALGGYGDQLDVGIKYSSTLDRIHYDLAWFVADDFGETSTDTMDDNNHWGSSTTYRKVNTAVANISFAVTKDHTIGLSYQSGKLQDNSSVNAGSNDSLVDVADDSIFGSHDAWDIWYQGKIGAIGVWAQILGTTRNNLDDVASGPVGADKTKTQRLAATVSYSSGPFNYYLDFTKASTDTDGNGAGDMVAWAPGVSYNYGPGWFYVEYLTQTNYIDRNGDVSDMGDTSNTDYKFSALYLTVDYYF